jgi:hypothetical protein
MIQAIGALCVAALGGLTIAAYRHPKEYQKLYLVLIIIIFVSMWIMAAFNAGNYWAQSAIWGSGVFEYDNASKATYAISDYKIPDWIMGVLPVALIGYIVFLSTFQYLLLDSDGGGGGGDKPGTGPSVKPIRPEVEDPGGDGDIAEKETERVFFQVGIVRENDKALDGALCRATI